jgi:putative Holliday junction resolvase
VVGLPRSLSGAVGPAAREARAEIDELRAAAEPGIAVEEFDERFTTVIAQRSLVDAGVRRDARREVVDKVAAAVMLQSYLEARMSAGRSGHSGAERGSGHEVRTPERPDTQVRRPKRPRAAEREA